MPCLNEARTVGACVRDGLAFLTKHGIDGEVLVVDNGSTDESSAIAHEAGARVVRSEQRGYGAALIAGMRVARGRFIVMGDADQSYDFSRLEAFLEKLRSGADLVMGNRFAGGIDAGAMPLLHRYLGNPVLSFIGRMFFRVPVRDFHCGLRGFRRDAMLHLRLASPGMEFASEMVAKAALAHLSIEEVPTVLHKDGRDRRPHLRTWRDGWRHLRFLLLFCPRWLFLYPGIALFLTGVAGFAVLRTGPLNLPFLGLDIHTLLFMGAALVIGAQMIQLALLTKWVAVLAGMIPQPRWVGWTLRWGSLELAVLCAAAVFIAGFTWSAGLALTWSSAGFGSLDPSRVMRQAIPSVTAMILGAQAGASALFAAALRSSWSVRVDGADNG